MSFDYQPFVEKADVLIERFGQAMTLRRTLPGAYDETTGLTTADVTSEYAAKGLELVLTRSADNAVMDGTLVEENRRLVLLSAKGQAITPKAADELDIGGEAWTVLGATPVSPGGTALVHKLEVKRNAGQ